jgi:hypothetical protein
MAQYPAAYPVMARQLAPGSEVSVVAATLVPFMVQIIGAPVLAFWNRMSDLPSPLKSPVPIAFQAVPAAAPRT